MLAFKRSLTIPLKHMISVSTERVPWVNYHRVRMMGTSIPGLVKDGHYLSSEGWIFYEIHNPDKCVTITLTDDEYKGIIFQVEDKESVAKLVNQVIAQRDLSLSHR